MQDHKSLTGLVALGAVEVTQTFKKDPSGSGFSFVVAAVEPNGVQHANRCDFVGEAELEKFAQTRTGQLWALHESYRIAQGVMGDTEKNLREAYAATGESSLLHTAEAIREHEQKLRTR